MTDRLQIDEHIRADSQVVRTWLTRMGDRIVVDVESPAGGAFVGALSAANVLQVVRRYARPLDPEVAAGLDGQPRLDLGGGAALVRLHWRAVVDADARDWLVLVAPGEEPQAAMAAGVAAALRYLVGRLAGERAARRGPEPAS